MKHRKKRENTAFSLPVALLGDRRPGRRRPTGNKLSCCQDLCDSPGRKRQSLDGRQHSPFLQVSRRACPAAQQRSSLNSSLSTLSFQGTWIIDVYFPRPIHLGLFPIHWGSCSARPALRQAQLCARLWVALKKCRLESPVCLTDSPRRTSYQVRGEAGNIATSGRNILGYVVGPFLHHAGWALGPCWSYRTLFLTTADWPKGGHVTQPSQSSHLF